MLPSPKHNVVRIDEAGDHQKRLARPSRFQGLEVQPANALAGDQRIAHEATQWIAADIATGTEYIDAVGLLRRTVVDRRLGVEIRLVHLELAEVRGLISEAFQYGRHIRNLGVESRDERVLHLVDDVMVLRWSAGEERRP